jgi:hypothetical protein
LRQRLVDFVDWQQYRSMKQSSRHIPCAETLKKQSFFRLGGRHTECACYFLNGITVKRNAFGKVLKQQADQVVGFGGTSGDSSRR